MPDVLPPVPLGPHHDLGVFSNGRHPSLDDWLKTRARLSEGWSARTYIIASAREPNCVIGYHCLCTAMIERAQLPSAKLRRDMPDPLPMMLIGRLAIDQRWQGRGLGSALLVDATRRCFAASEIIGARGIIAHAMDDDAAHFYQRHGFLITPIERLMLLPMETAGRLLAET
ncbi:MAG: GNAT family N-acetyltransferase [Proteobacteria bacterium]|nr:GNAT family N-acetyltransferase [Pseudomonadota bacterium]